jgi:hypothetical protein
MDYNPETKENTPRLINSKMLKAINGQMIKCPEPHYTLEAGTPHYPCITFMEGKMKREDWQFEFYSS